MALCISSYNGSAISMRIDEVIFWDQELVSKFLLKGKKILKRIVDIVGASAALILLLPIMAIIAFGVKLTSPGSILFKQRRVGYKGNYFTFLKFRSMVAGNTDCLHQDFVKKLIHGEIDQINNGTKQDPCYKIINDPRITPFGQILRKTSLDELPQFFNVLKGEMSLVGPRPPIPYEVDEYKNWHYRRILEVKPGITGLWQVTGRNKTCFDEMVRLDIQYAEHWSLTMDLKILLKTIKAVFAADGI
jgi:lipopolysaccharide/colanic/teichoic acid biosynthesis glycosyltransferase